MIYVIHIFPSLSLSIAKRHAVSDTELALTKLSQLNLLRLMMILSIFCQLG